MSKRLQQLALSAVLFGSMLVMAPASVNAATCTQNGTNCVVGSVGPMGGIVFYDAGSMQWWGRYLEVMAKPVAANAPWGLVNSIYTDGEGGLSIAQQRARAKQIGMGSFNTQKIVANSGTTETVASAIWNGTGGVWHLPSKNELDTLYNSWKINGLKGNWGAAPAWTSTEASDGFAWYQLFQDGTQFTDANGIIPGKTSNKTDPKSPVHVGSGFKSMKFQALAIRAFPPSTGVIPMSVAVPFAPLPNAACSAGGSTTVCKVGDIGPGGGIVFYDAGSDQPWGRYLEVAPVACEAQKIPWRIGKKMVYMAMNGQSAANLRLLAKRVGMGEINTGILTQTFGANGPYAAKFAEDLVCGGRDDWFLPSKDELDLVYNNIAQNRVGGQDTPLGSFNKGYYWTSTDYNNATAWTQYFMDGQQFDRVQTLFGNLKPPANPFRVRPIRAFGSGSE